MSVVGAEGTRKAYMVMSSFLTSLFAEPPFSLRSAWLGYINYMVKFLTDYYKEFEGSGRL